MSRLTKYVYVLTMYKDGSRENHSYVVGVYTSIHEAEKAAKEEKMERANKYEYEIVVHELGISRLGVRAISTLYD